MSEPFILRDGGDGYPTQENFDSLDAALDEFAWVRYRSGDVTEDGLTTWWPTEIVRPDGTIMVEDELERLRPPPPLDP